MKITLEPKNGYSILHLHGEFDGLRCPFFLHEIEDLVDKGERNIALDLRLVSFVNSTAMGAMVKAAKILAENNGKLALSAPSGFCRNVMEAIGLPRVIPIFDTVTGAARHLRGVDPAPEIDDDQVFEEDTTALLFSPVDAARIEEFIPELKVAKAENPVHGHAFGRIWRGVGRMTGLDSDGLRFTWNGGRTGLTPAEIGKLLAAGIDLKVKFRLPLLERGPREGIVSVVRTEEQADGVNVRVSYKKLDADTRHAVEQYVKDMAFLKNELTEATEG